jgi:dienelactone hydrolase
MDVMRPPIPRAWFGLAFFFGVAATFVITRTLENWTALVPVSPSLPLGTQRVLLTLELMLFAVAVQAIWWAIGGRRLTHGKTPLVVLLTLGTSMLAPMAAQQPSLDVVPQARAILIAIVAGDFTQVERQFTVDMKAALPSGALAALWAQLLNQVGAYKSCGTAPRVRSIDDKRMVIMPCEFERTTIDIQFAFDSAGRISGLVFRPGVRTAVAYTLPSYGARSAFIERELTLGPGEWALPATLTVPVEEGSWPAVVLVHGSGPNDRDETVGANKPFKDLATGLASRGIAVLRYDKRTLVHRAKVAALKDFTVKQEVIDDALEAVKAVRAQPGIDTKRVFVLGHSLGGMLIPRIGAADPALAGLIVLAGAARPLEEAIVAQTRYLTRVDGTISTEEQRAIEQATAIASSVRALKTEEATSGRVISGAPASYWLDLRGYDPASEATRVKTPMLILQGERDFQVTMEDFARWKAALGSRRDVTFRSYPSLNHLFIAGTGPSLPAEYQVPGHVAEEIIRDIATWIVTSR